MEKLVAGFEEELHSTGKAEGTAKSYRRRVNRFLCWWGEQNRPLTLRLLVDYAIYLQTKHEGDEGEGCRPRTIHGHFAALKSFWRYARREGEKDLPDIRVVPLPRLDPPHNVTPNDDAIDRLVAAAPRAGRTGHDPEYRDYRSHRAVAVITLGLFLGLRRDEMRQLNKPDLYQDQRGWHMRIRRSKGGEARIIPVSEVAYEKLAAWLKVRDARCEAKGVTHNAFLIDPSCARIGVHGLGRIVEEVKLLAGLEDSGITPHSLRHGCATLLIRCGVDLPTIQKILGHASLETTMKYLHTDYSQMQGAADALGRRLSGKQAEPEFTEKAARPPLRRTPGARSNNLRRTGR
jgi:site-specific recombinase XerD